MSALQPLPTKRTVRKEMQTQTPPERQSSNHITQVQEPRMQDPATPNQSQLAQPSQTVMPVVGKAPDLVPRNTRAPKSSELEILPTPNPKL